MNTALLGRRPRQSGDDVLQSGMNLRSRSGTDFPGTFTRAGKAWVAGAEVAADTPRTLNYAGGTLLLLESERTNLMTASDLRAAVNYNTSGTTVTKGTLSNGQTGVTWTQAATAQAAPVNISPTDILVSSGAVYTLSFGYRVISGLAGLKAALALADATTGTFRYSLSPDGKVWNTSASETQLLQASAPATGRFVLTLPPIPEAGLKLVAFYAVRTVANFQVELWGAQFEAGPCASSLIPTATAAASRARESYSATLGLGENFTISFAYWSQNPGWYGPTFDLENYGTTGNNKAVFAFYQGQHSLVCGNDTVQVVTGGAAPTLGQWHRVHLVVEGTRVTRYVDGALHASGTLNFPFPAHTALLRLHHASGDNMGAWLAPGAPLLNIPLIRPYALTPRAVWAEEARWKPTLNAASLPTF